MTLSRVILSTTKIATMVGIEEANISAGLLVNYRAEMKKIFNVLCFVVVVHKKQNYNPLHGLYLYGSNWQIEMTLHVRVLQSGILNDINALD